MSEEQGKQEVVCYHHNDADGRMAATVVHSIYPEAKFISVNYKSEAKQEDYKNKLTIIVDFSFPKETMERILEGSQLLCWIDHHETAKKNMPELWNSNDIDGLREIGKCGAMLTWEWFCPTEIIPIAIELVNDYDLWLHKDPRTKYLAERLNLFRHPFRPKEWENLILLSDETILYFLEEGILLYEAKVQRCENAIRRGTEELFNTNIPGQKPIKTIYAQVYPEDFSETGARILDKGYDISVTYCRVHGSTMVGLRSKTIDVSKIAETYQGGGHDHAAGFHVDDINLTKAGEEPNAGNKDE